jgi:DNA-binding NarL/FixJ family response regulator
VRRAESRNMPVSVLIADDHQLMLDALTGALTASPDFDVVGTTDTGPHVLPMVSRLRPDMVLCDVRMPDLDGLQCLDRLQDDHPAVKVVLISATGDPPEVADALRRGAAGWISKAIDPSDLPAAMRQAWLGTAFFPTGVAPESRTAHAQRATGLSDREVEVLSGVVAGWANKRIARELVVTEQTVKFHLSNVYRKLDVSSRTGAAAFAMRAGIPAAVDAAE